MPKVTDTTARYIVRAIVPNGDGSYALRQWTVASLAHMPALHTSFADIPKTFWKHNTKYQQEDGSYRGRSKCPRDNRGIYIERLNFVQIEGKPLRRSKGDTASE